jgi:cellulose synthase/poly-beta-1,6-N-acetylglucosamine synthase-like glycosyltransferase
MTFFLILIWLLCVLGVLHTYVCYPWQMSRWARPQVQGKLDGRAPITAGPKLKHPTISFDQEPTPAVYVLMAAHNEAAVLEDKLRSLAAQDYAGPLTFLIGSDCSTDRTNDILTEWADKDGRFRPTLFTLRQGKPGIINQLAAQALAAAPPAATAGNAPSAIFVMTDASVMLRPDTVRQLVAPMTVSPLTGVVDATMVQTGGTTEGIGGAETSYINREVALKRAEGERWGTMIGPFGGCWAMRAVAYETVPHNFLVDDFFLCMAAYEKGFRGYSQPAAVVEEAVGQSIADEFRRKVRISSGNWQNLVRFRKLWWPCWRDPLAYAFFSHKILRWWTPFLLLIGLGAWLLLLLTLGAENNYWPGLTLLVLMGMVSGLVALDRLLSLLNVHFRPGRYLSYFIAMNAALLVGCWRYLTGIKSNVWQPSQRH